MQRRYTVRLLSLVSATTRGLTKKSTIIQHKRTAHFNAGSRKGVHSRSARAGAGAGKRGQSVATADQRDQNVHDIPPGKINIFCVVAMSDIIWADLTTSPGRICESGVPSFRLNAEETRGRSIISSCVWNAVLDFGVP